MVRKSPSSVAVLPGPPGNRVSPESSTGEPSMRKQIEPPGVQFQVWDPQAKLVALRLRGAHMAGRGPIH